MKKFGNSLFLFTRDLRLSDNRGLIQACKESEKVFPCFIFDPKLISEKNSTYSEFRIQFLIESIGDLIEQFKKKKAILHLFHDSQKKIIPKIIETNKIDAVFTNFDYSPFARKKQQMLEKIVPDIPLILCHDLLLHEVELIKTDKDKPYVIYSQFFKKAKTHHVSMPQKNNFLNFLTKPDQREINLTEVTEKKSFDFKNKIKGGRTEAMKILKNLFNLRDYKIKRNFPSQDYTTRLSAHNKFGTCSIREEYHEIANQLGPDHELIGEIFWRDFFTYIMYHFPYSFAKPFRKKYSKIPWSKNNKFFERWCKGTTGFPIVDAGMRELNSTGYMHNRVRMIVASFLTKDLHIDWKQGERYFAKKLIDYDPCVNVGNWQWAASTGCDSQPWFRIFNPWLQQERYDSECKYIKKWIPELEKFTPKEIHRWDSMTEKSDYPKPIVTHSEESSHTKEIFQKISKS